MRSYSYRVHTLKATLAVVLRAQLFEARRLYNTLLQVKQLEYGKGRICRRGTSSYGSLQSFESGIPEF